MESLFSLRFLATERASETANLKIQSEGHIVTVECMEQVAAADLERSAQGSCRAIHISGHNRRTTERKPLRLLSTSLPMVGRGGSPCAPDPPSRLRPPFGLPVGEGERPGKLAVELLRHCSQGGIGFFTAKVGE